MSAEFHQVSHYGQPDAGAPASTSQRDRFGPFTLYKIGVLLIVLALVYLDIPTYFNHRFQFPLTTHFFLAIVIVGAPLLLRFKSLTLYLATPFAFWVFALVALNGTHLLVAMFDGEEARAGLIASRIAYAVFALLLGFAYSTTRNVHYERMFPLLAIVIPALLVVDFLNPGTFYSYDIEGPVIGRAAATFINPNKAGEGMLIACLLAIPVLGFRHRVPLLLWVGTGIILTFSRGAIVAWALLWLFLTFRKAVPRYSLAVFLLAVAAFPLLLGSFESYLSGRADLTDGIDNILARLQFFQDRVVDDDSGLERGQILQAGLDLFLRNPVFGVGAAATHLWSLPGGTHNEPVMLAAEYGIFGIVQWVWLAVILYKGSYFEHKSYQMAAVIGFVFLSLFSHNIFDYLYWLLTFALIAGRRNA